MTVNHGVTGSSPVGGAIYIWPFGEAVNSYAFHAYIHGFESRKGHHLRRLGLIQYIKPFLFAFYRVQVPPVLIKDGIFSF